MSVPIQCVVAFAAWTLALVAAIEIRRGLLMSKGEFTMTDFPAGLEHGPAGYWRLNRAHANCLEMLPVFAAVVFGAEFSELDSNLFAGLAVAVVVLRCIQSGIHVSSGETNAIQWRATAFITQILCVGAMSFLLVADAVS